ncbi:MAG: SsrA-binding protein [Caldiserica bacterium]|nr:SsrA-binding protein [Caldisericota bacterium]
MVNKSGVIVANKRIQHNFKTLERLEAGIELRGWEVKAIRSRTFAFGDSYCRFYGHELYLVQMSVGPYAFAHTTDEELKRRRRLLVHHREIVRIASLISQQGLTVVPASLSFSEGGFVKVDLAVGKFLATKGSRDTFEKRRVEREIRGYVR